VTSNQRRTCKKVLYGTELEVLPASDTIDAKKCRFYINITLVRKFI